MAKLPPDVAKAHASLRAELSAIETNRVVNAMEKVYSHATTGGNVSRVRLPAHFFSPSDFLTRATPQPALHPDVAQPKRRRRRRDDGEVRAKSRSRIGRLSRDKTGEELDEEEEADDRFSKVPEPSWSKRNRRKRGRNARIRRDAAVDL